MHVTSVSFKFAIGMKISNDCFFFVGTHLFLYVTHIKVIQIVFAVSHVKKVLKRDFKKYP